MLRAQHVVWALQRCRKANFHLWQYMSKKPPKASYFPVRKYATEPAPLRWEIADSSPISTSPPPSSELKPFEPLDRGVLFAVGFPADKESELHFVNSVYQGEYSNVVDCVEKHGIEIQDHYGNTPLHWAAASGQVEIFRFLLSLDANIHKSNKQGLTPLFAAACGGSAQIIELLIEKGALTAIRDFSGHTALHYAAWMGNKEVVETLVKNHKFSIEATSNARRTPLHYASANSDTTSALLSLGAKVDAQDDEGMTPLHFAAAEGGVVVKLLAKAGADLENLDNEKFTPIMHAASAGHIATLRDLCECGANVNFMGPDGTTPLMRAAGLSSTEAMEVLLSHGAKLDLQSGEDGDTALTFAIGKGHIESAKFLIEKGSNLELERKDENTPLTIAIQSDNDLELIRVLVRAGAKVNGKGTAWPLHLACFIGKKNVVEELVRLGADLEMQSAKIGDTPLFTAVNMGHADVAAWLIKNGANVNATNLKSETPLHAAATGECVELLVNAGAKIHAVDIMEGAPIHMAALYSRTAVMEKLAAMGADINMVSTNQELGTPLQVAASKSIYPKDSINCLVRLRALVNKPNTVDLTPMFYARDADAVNALADAGADVNARGGIPAQHEPLTQAALKKNASAVLAMLQRGANVNASSSTGWSTLMFAVYVTGNSEVVSLLLEHGADVNAVTKNGNVALHMAAKSTHDVALFHKLVPSAGVDVKNNKGQSPLYVVLSTNKSPELLKVVAKFMEMGASIDNALAQMRAEGKGDLANACEQLKVSAQKLLQDGVKG